MGYVQRTRSSAKRKLLSNLKRIKKLRSDNKVLKTYIKRAK